MNPYVIGGAALVLATVTAWGFYERSEKLEAEKDVVSLTAQVEVLADKLNVCNEAVKKHEASAAEAQKRSEAALKAAAALEAKNRGERVRLKMAIAKPTPKGAGCDAAWGEIERLKGR
jgi:hypothetical protein